MHSGKPFFLWRHLNKLRWLSLSIVFAMLVALPFLHIYQTYVAAHAYDLLSAPEQRLYDVMETLSKLDATCGCSGLPHRHRQHWLGSANQCRRRRRSRAQSTLTRR